MATETLPPSSADAAKLTKGATAGAPVDPKIKTTQPPSEASASSDKDIDATAPAAEEGPRKLPFMQQAWVQDVLPLATSIILHVGIIGLGFATYKTVVAIKQVVEEQAIIPDAAIIEGAEVGGIPNPGLGGDPTKASAQDEFKDVPTQNDAWNSKPSDSLAQSLAGAQGETADTTIGIGPNSSFGSAKGAEGGVGPGGEAGGALSPFGVPGGGGGLGPKSPFMGISGNAKQIVYICDATGTMLGLKFELLKQQLAKAIDILRPVQSFNVVFFKGGNTDAEWAKAIYNKLTQATPMNKQKAFKEINETSVLGNGTNPIPALKQAFAQKPQLIYFLTDGEFNNFASYDDVLNEVAKLNADKSVRINTILMMGEDDKAEETLKKMAKDNGGVFKKVLETDLR